MIRIGCSCPDLSHLKAHLMKLSRLVAPSVLLSLFVSCCVASAADAPQAKPKAGKNGFSVKKKIAVPVAKPAAKPAEPSGPKPTIANVPYGDDPSQVLDFYKCESAAPTPLVFYIHGGG